MAEPSTNQRVGIESRSDIRFSDETRREKSMRQSEICSLRYTDCSQVRMALCFSQVKSRSMAVT